MVDCSHGNSRKDYRRQAEVAAEVAEQVASGSPYICGVMIESHLVEGRQDLVPGKPLTYGQSITDACISWETTVPILEQLAAAVKEAAYADRLTAVFTRRSRTRDRTRCTPLPRRRRSPVPAGATFSISTKIESPAIQAMFITPPAKSSAISAQQHPMQ